MKQGPRPPDESLIDKVMMAGIIIHNIVLTGLAIGVFVTGLSWETGSWNADHSVVTNGMLSESTCLSFCVY